MNVSAGLVLDLGNSETRGILIVNKKEYPFFLSNKFADLEAGYVINAKYKNDKSTIFLTDTTYFANGYIVDMEFKNRVTQSNALNSKHEQLATKLSLNLAFIHSINKLHEIYGVPVEDMNIDFKVSILLPPLDHDLYEVEMMELVQGITKVTSVIPTEMTKEFTISKVTVFPEGVAAFFGVEFTESVDGTQLVDIEENKKFQTGYVLIMDIGAGTTDLAIIKDSALVQGSKNSIKKGGNNVESAIKSAIHKQYKFVPTDMTSIITRGILEEGTVEHDVSSIVTDAKRKYSLAVKNELIDYIQTNMIEMREIKGLLVVGGGSLAAERDGKIVSPAMSDILLEFLRELAPNIGVVSMAGQNPRLLNITGLKYVHKFVG